MNSKYKVGDKVTIRKTYHKGFNWYDYPYSFTEEMLNRYGGQVFTIDKVKEDHSYSLEDKALYIEPYKYYLSGNSFTWSAAMFEETNIKDCPIIIVINKKQKHKFNFNL